MCTIVDVVLCVLDFSQCNYKVFSLFEAFKSQKQNVYSKQLRSEQLVKITERKIRLLMETKFIQR